VLSYSGKRERKQKHLHAMQNPMERKEEEMKVK
jgi:hypothetical protein